MHDEDGRSIAREWKREVEEQERLGDRGRDDGRGRAVVWLVLWLIWLVCLGAVIGWLTGHR